MSLEMIARSSWVARAITQDLQAIFGRDREFVRKTAEDLNKRFLRWISQESKRPFFVFLNYMDAHSPYLPPKPFDTMFGSKRTWPDQSNWRQWSQQEIQAERDAYDGSIAYLDHQLGLLFGELQ